MIVTENRMHRIAVIGTSGSGKTTLARELARRLDVPSIEIDALYHMTGWVPRPLEEFRGAVQAYVDQPAWTLCGNYGQVRDIVLGRADTIIWLSYPMTLTFWRVLCRTIRRGWRREELWNGNRERLWVQFFTSDSLLLWVINTWRKHRRDYPRLLREQRALGKRVLRFRSPEQTRRWLDSVR
jgi:adenylate kinase family enzyme